MLTKTADTMETWQSLRFLEERIVQLETQRYKKVVKTANTANNKLQSETINKYWSEVIKSKHQEMQYML